MKNLRVIARDVPVILTAIMLQGAAITELATSAGGAPTAHVVSLALQGVSILLTVIGVVEHGNTTTGTTPPPAS